jgi:hypothetical protein
MPNRIRTNIELTLNIVVAIAIVIVLGIAVKRFLFTSPTIVGAPRPELGIGSPVTVPNVDWQQNKKSLIFFLKKDCAYCNQSAPFYRSLIEDAAKRDVKLLAILPGPIEVGTQYVQSLNLSIKTVQTGSLAHYQIPGAPSLVFVDDHGIARGVWIGMPPPNLQEKMRRELTALFDRDSF